MLSYATRLLIFPSCLLSTNTLAWASIIVQMTSDPSTIPYWGWILMYNPRSVSSSRTRPVSEPPCTSIEAWIWNCAEVPQLNGVPALKWPPPDAVGCCCSVYWYGHCNNPCHNFHGHGHSPPPPVTLTLSPPLPNLVPDLRSIPSYLRNHPITTTPLRNTITESKIISIYLN